MDGNVQRALERFFEDPQDQRAFESLEEHYFLNSTWEDLLQLYEARLRAPDVSGSPDVEADLRFRIGQVLEERCGDDDRAIACYQEVARQNPEYRPALVQLRRIYVRREAWDLALQIAEVEAGLPMAPYELAAFYTDLGEIWHLHMDDVRQGLEHYERALASDPAYGDALLGAARAYEAMGEEARAATALEKLVDQKKGPDCALPLASLARLYAGPLGNPERAESLYRRALTFDPMHRDSLEALCDAASAKRHWDLVAELMERRFEIARSDDEEREIALAAGTLLLEQLRDAHGARLWFMRTVAKSPDDVDTLLGLAAVERQDGNRSALRSYLERLRQVAPDAISLDVLRELATLNREQDDESSAIEALLAAREREPGDLDILAELAVSFERLGRDDDRIEVLEDRAKRLDEGPLQRTAWLQIGALCEERQSDPERAIRAYERVLRSEPGSVEATAALERLFTEGGRHEDLRTLLERAARAGSGSRAVGAWARLGDLLIETFEDPASARDAYQRALTLDRSAPRALRGLERVAVETGDEDAILDAFEREAAVTTDRARLSFLVFELIKIFDRREQPDEALLWVERLRAVTPEDREVLTTAASLQEQLDMLEELGDTLGQLDGVLQGGDQAANRRRLAGVFEKRGRPDETIAAYQSALEIEPEDTESLRALVGHLEQQHRNAELAAILGQLAELTAGEERVSSMRTRAELLEGPLGDRVGALAVLEELGRENALDADDRARLYRLLEETGRFDSLAEQLAAEADAAGDDTTLRAQLDLRRARLLLERLGEPAQAADAVRRALANEGSLPPEAATEANVLLESAVRRSDDPRALETLLRERAGSAIDPAAREQMELERAQILSRDLDDAAAAREVLAALADGHGVARDEARERLLALLEAEEAYDELCARLEAEIEELPSAEHVDRMVQVAQLRRVKLSDVDGAAHWLERALDRAPKRRDLWGQLLALHEDAGRDEDVARCLERELEAGADGERERWLRSRAIAVYRDTLERPGVALEHATRLLELDPEDGAAAAYVCEGLEAAGREDELAVVIARRIEGLRPESEEAISQRLRLAALLAGPLARIDDAIEVLEAGIAHQEGGLVLAEPLADLYQRSRRSDSLLELCRGQGERAESALERAQWSLRLADALRENGDLSEAAEAYRQVLGLRPDDRSAHAALRDLYRRLGESEPLVRLLEVQLTHLGGAEEQPVRLELADLLEGSLERPADALVHVRRVLEFEPSHAAALEQALRLARRVGDPADLLGWLDAAIERTPSPGLRAAHYAERARLLHTRLERPHDAVESYGRALELAPGDILVRREMRALCESLGDWTSVLDCLEREAAEAAGDERFELLDQAARIATRRFSSVASLIWLERMRAVRPGNQDVLERLAEVHRRAGSAESLLAVLRERLELGLTEAERVPVLQECATLYSEQLDHPRRAIECLEQARGLRGDDPALADALARLYTKHEQHGPLAALLEARIEAGDDARVPEWRETLIGLLTEQLDEPGRAAPHLLSAVGEAQGFARVERLQKLGAALRGDGRPDAWVRVASEELAALDPEDRVFDERRFELHRDLGRALAALGRPLAALPHWRALIDGSWSNPESEDVREAESFLIDALRAQREPVELERRLRTRAEREPDEGVLWLEIGDLLENALHRPAAATAAYRRARDLDGSSLAAIRGLRRTTDLLGDSAALAESLEAELEASAGERSPSQTAALYRRLGEVAWRSLDSTTRASRAFAAALEADPGDQVSLRSLQTLFESMDDWRGALDLYESEIEVLGDEDPERRHAVWLRVGQLASGAVEEPERALRGYEAAEALGVLDSTDERRFAELYARQGIQERFVSVFERWCQRDDTEPDANDWLRLAQGQAALQANDEALASARRSVEIDPDLSAAWDLMGELREADDDGAGAAEQWICAAGCLSGREAADRLVRAARLVEPESEERAVELLGRAVEHEPDHAEALARWAHLAHAIDSHDVAAHAALRVLEIGIPEDADVELGREALLAGARSAARALRHDDARRLFGAYTEHAPDHEEALIGLGEALFALGEAAAAREPFERCVELAQTAPERARLLVRLAEALEASGRGDDALGRFREAIALDARIDEAHDGAIRILRDADRIDEAVDVLEAWAARATEPEDRGERLLGAARLELSRPDREEQAEALLREATSVHPKLAEAWSRLATLVAGTDRANDALDVSTRGLEAIPDDRGARAVLSQVRGEALEERGDRAAAAEAYADAVTADPSRTDSAQAAARLLRALGEWSRAAELLESLVDRYDGGDDQALAQCATQLGRLRAGPLEDVEGAIEAYRSALRADPALEEANEGLAGLLVHVPELWREATDRHRGLVERTPTRAASVRALLLIAERRDEEALVATGLGLLRGLGVATAEERLRAPAQVPLGLDGSLGLEDPVYEAVRCVGVELAREIGEALGVGSPDTPGGGDTEDDAARLRSRVVAFEADLAGAALVPLADADLGAALRLAVQLVLEAEAVHGDGHLVNALSQKIGRRSRRRARKALGDVTAAQVEAIDWSAWRTELRALATAAALRDQQAEFRAGLVHWLLVQEDDLRIRPESDLTPLVENCPEALALLRRVVTRWIDHF